MHLLSTLALLTLSAATVNRSVETCDELPVPFVVPATVGTDAEIADFLALRSESYCSESGNGTAWCACYSAGLIRD